MIRIKAPKTCKVDPKGALVMYSDYRELDSKFNELAKSASDLVVASSKLLNASNAEEAEVATEAMAESQARIDAIVKAKEAA